MCQVLDLMTQNLVNMGALFSKISSLLNARLELWSRNGLHIILVF
jgi:hypothetical protein